ncbi:MAG: D-aminoacylase [Bacteroidota bacterium]
MKSPIVLLSIGFLAICLAMTNCTPQYEIIIQNGLVYDGSGAAPFEADIAVADGKIVEIAEKINNIAERKIDAEGLVVAPGFIDVHAHLGPLPMMPDAQSHVRQGVTTAVGGPDGGSPLSIGNYLDSLEAIGIGMNVAYLIGHNAVRTEVLGLDNRAPTPEEMESMKGHVEKAMLEGAFGISTGLKYLPGAFAKTEEVVELSKVVAKYGGVYTTHMREEGLGLLDAVEETIGIAEGANIPVVITHHKAIGQPVWGQSKNSLAMVDSARARGLNVMIDQYPYTASSTSLSVLIPPWAMEGGQFVAFDKRCEDPVLRDSIKRGIVFNILNDRGGGDLRRIQFSSFDWKPELNGKTLYDWALAENLEPNAENGAELVIQAQLRRGAKCIFHAINEEDVKRIMAHPQTMIASDGRLNELNQGHPHPRAYGTFPRVLGYYAREEKVIHLETAIYKMSGLPAKNFNIKKRGVLQKGNYADITIFDAATIIDKATFEAPHQYPEGIHFVIVNGKITLEGIQYYDVRAGRTLRKEMNL